LENTDATVILTEWNEFRNLNFDKFNNIGAGEYFFDLRNIYDKKIMVEKGFKYYGVGV
jgi:UDPglucose 6-dehydrogenase